MRRFFASYRIFLSCSLALLALGLQSSHANAAFQLQLNYEFSASGSGNLDAGTLTFTQNGSNLDVLFTGGSGLGFIGDKGLYFNLSNIAGITGGSITGVSTTGYNGSAPVFSFNYSGASGGASFKADGDGFFDVRVQLDHAPPGDRFGAGDTLSFTIKNTTEANAQDVSVGGPAGKDGFYAAVHAQGLGAGGGLSGWYTDNNSNDNGVQAVPAPPSVLLAISGAFCCGLGGLARRWRRPTAAA